jgi:hypothetical protein
MREMLVLEADRLGTVCGWGESLWLVLSETLRAPVTAAAAANVPAPTAAAGVRSGYFDRGFEDVDMDEAVAALSSLRGSGVRGCSGGP